MVRGWGVGGCERRQELKRGASALRSRLCQVRTNSGGTCSPKTQELGRNSLHLPKGGIRNRSRGIQTLKTSARSLHQRASAI